MKETHIKTLGTSEPYILTGEDIESFNKSYHHWATSQNATWLIPFNYKGGLLELNMRNVCSIEQKNLASATNTN